MSIYSCSISNVSRGKGSSSLANLSYISGEKYRDERLGQSFSYGREERVIKVDTLLPVGSPESFSDPGKLFNSIEQFEKAENARTAKKIMVALPVEFDLETQIQTVEEYIKKELNANGYACTYAIHHDQENINPHAHILIANRAIDEKTGEWSAKRKMEYALDEKGERIPIIDKETGLQKVDKRNRKQWKRVSTEVNYLDKKETLIQLRKSWAEVCNSRLSVDNQIDHRSLKEQGSPLEPTIHEGYKARAIEASGGIAERCEINREIKARNALILEIQTQLQAIGKELKELLGKLEQKGADFSERLGSLLKRRTDTGTPQLSRNTATGVGRERAGDPATKARLAYERAIRAFSERETREIGRQRSRTSEISRATPKRRRDEIEL